MAIILNQENIEILKKSGLEILSVYIEEDLTFCPPCGIKFSSTAPYVELGAFSYIVSGYICAVKIGRYCSFGENVQIGRQGHPIDWVTTSPFLYMKNEMIVPMNNISPFHYINEVQAFPLPPTNLKTTIIGNDVWIGQGAIILPGINIGNGAIIAAGAVVTKDVTPYSIVGGNPANLIKYRIPFEMIAEMEATEWWNYSPKDLNQLPVWSPGLFIEAFNKIKNTLVPYSKEFLKVSDLIN